MTVTNRSCSRHEHTNVVSHKEQDQGTVVRLHTQQDGLEALFALDRETYASGAFQG